MKRFIGFAARLSVALQCITELLKQFVSLMWRLALAILSLVLPVMATCHLIEVIKALQACHLTRRRAAMLGGV